MSVMSENSKGERVTNRERKVLKPNIGAIFGKQSFLIISEIVDQHLNDVSKTETVCAKTETFFWREVTRPWWPSLFLPAVASRLLVALLLVPDID